MLQSCTTTGSTCKHFYPGVSIPASNKHRENSQEVMRWSLLISSLKASAQPDYTEKHRISHKDMTSSPSQVDLETWKRSEKAQFLPCGEEVPPREIQRDQHLRREPGT